MESKQHVSNFQFFLEMLNLLATIGIIVLIFLSQFVPDSAYPSWMLWVGLCLAIVPVMVKRILRIKFNLIQFLAIIAAVYWLLAIAKMYNI